jgi:hypothetical protein
MKSQGGAKSEDRLKQGLQGFVFAFSLLLLALSLHSFAAFLIHHKT